MANNSPVKKFRRGFVEAAVWRNKHNGNEFYSVSLTRTYKDGDEYKNTDNLGSGDLLNAAHVIMRASAWIDEQVEE